MACLFVKTKFDFIKYTTKLGQMISDISKVEEFL